MQVASFGGTLGLLTGTSFIGLVEVAFWVVRLAKKAVQYKS